MRIAVVGSRDIHIDERTLALYLASADEIISGGAKGVDMRAADYAINNNIKLIEFLPKYDIYGRAAPIIRNKEIVNYADKVIAFWNGKSKGTLSVIKYANKLNKECIVIMCDM